MIGQAHGVTELGTVHDFRSQERIWLERPAQLAVQTARLVEVDALADQGRSVAAATPLAVRVAAVGRATNQRDLKFGSALIGVIGIRHLPSVRRRAGGSCRGN